MKMRSVMVVFCLVAAGQSVSAASPEPEVAYPEGYRHWYHVKSMVIAPGHALAEPFQGIHHVYANETALRGLRTGEYAAGAVLVFDLLDYVERDHALYEGERRLIGVMERDPARFAKTGGWGFEGFAGEGMATRLTQDGGQSCFACHQPREAEGYVFSELRD